jgi:hypothetical protein
LERLLFDAEFLFQDSDKISVVTPRKAGLGKGDRAKQLSAVIGIV